MTQFTNTNTNTNTNGQCPHCGYTFDAIKATIAFPGKITGKKISLVFALCPSCYDAISLGDEIQQTEMIKTSFTNVIKHQNIDWTVTSSLALDANFGDFFNAWWYGIDLTRPIFDAINNGLVEEVAFSPSLAEVSKCKS